MSGPKTSHYSIRAARQQEQERRQAAERKRREEMAARVVAANEKRAELEKKALRLSVAVGELRQRFPLEKVSVSVPDRAAPLTEDPEKLEEFVGRLESDLLQAETDIRKAGNQAKANQDFRNATKSAADLCGGASSTAEEVMRRFVESRAAKPSGSARTERHSEIDRILRGQGLENWQEATPRLESLVLEALSTESDNRFAALTTEIRVQVQEIKRREKTRRADAERAKTLLDRLDVDVPIGEESLKQRLELVRVGAIPFFEGFEKLVNVAITKAVDTDKARIQASAAHIVKETLTDLGYDVAPIEETLFVKGGKVYFRKSGWNNYCVRLTVRPDESKINFNVVRIAEQAENQESSSRVADVEAENAWCSGYQKLVDTLAVRGLDTRLTRHLPIGAVPVQSVGTDEISLLAFGPEKKKRKTRQVENVRGGSNK
jgi:hypothetical protein